MMTTAGWQSHGIGELTARPLVRAMLAVERATFLDTPARGLESLAQALLGSPTADAALRGTWLGHAVHPLLTDFPLGAWSSATLLDLFGGRRARPAATGLVAFGVAAAVPTAAAGLAEWRATAGPARRVGVGHAAVNTTALGLYGASLVARLHGHHHRAVLLALAGGVTATAGGYLGGHLSLVRKIGYSDPAFGSSRPGRSGAGAGGLVGEESDGGEQGAGGQVQPVVGGVEGDDVQVGTPDEGTEDAER